MRFKILLIIGFMNIIMKGHIQVWVDCHQRFLLKDYN